MLIALRWPLLLLYVIVVAALVAAALVAQEWWGLVLILLALGCQVLFFATRGSAHSLQPVTHRQILAPTIIAGLMTSILLIAMGYALTELYQSNHPWSGMTLVFLLASWGFWGLLFATCFHCDYLKAVRRIVLMLMGGSLLQLLVTYQSHMTVSRRGCSAGTRTSAGVAAGLCVLLWAFGPAIVLLFMYEARKHKTGRCPGCGYLLRGLPGPRCPECGRGFTPREVRMTLEEVRSMGAKTGKLLCDHCDYENPPDEKHCLRCGDELQLPGEEAFTALERSRANLSVMRRLMGEKHPYVIDTLGELAEAERRLGMPAEAEHHAREGVALARELPDQQHSGLSRALLPLARILLQEGGAKAAEKVVYECIELSQTGPSRDAGLVAEAECVLGRCMTVRGKPAEAEPLLIRSFETLRAKVGDSDRRTLRALNGVIDAYIALDRWDKATEYQSTFSKLSR